MINRRQNLVVGNWKMNPATVGEARALTSAVERGLANVNRRRVQVALCPPALFLPVIQELRHFAALGAQNVAATEPGAFTGELAAAQMQDLGVKYVIIGHSERRALGETDKLINQKIRIALKYGLEPIFCVGFGTKKSHSLSAIKIIIKRQLRAALRGVALARICFAIAYEPVWAISRGFGTSRPATPEHAATILKFIRLLAPQAKLLYGGSLDGKNAARFAAQKTIQGALVGGASLRAADFLKIVKSFSS